MGSVPGWGTRILHASRRGQKKKEEARELCCIFPPCEDALWSWQSATWKSILSRTRPRWHPDLDLSLQNCVKYICYLEATQSVLLCYSSLNGLRQRALGVQENAFVESTPVLSKVTQRQGNPVLLPWKKDLCLPSLFVIPGAGFTLQFPE